MNPKRKAELQRKLSIMPVPRPPLDLIDRIKADIPADLAAVTSRGSRTPAAFTLRVAASILIVLASTAFVTLYLLRGRETAFPSAAAPRSAAVPALAQPKALPEAEVTVSLAETPRANDAIKPAMVVAESKEKDRGQASGRSSTAAEKKEMQQFAPIAIAGNVRPDAAESAADVAGGAPAAGVAPSAPAVAEKARVTAVAGNLTVTASAPAVVDAPAATPAEASALPQRASRGAAADIAAERKTTQARSPLAKTLPDVQTRAAAPREMFGISMDPAALGRVQKTIESGQRPAAGSVDVEAIVSYLASAPGGPATAVSFDVEASREPDVVNSRSAMIRFTIDTARAPARGGSIGSDAKLEIGFDDVAVGSYRIFGNARPLTLKEPLLFDNASVTGVIEVTLNSGLSPHQQVATLKLHYFDASGHSQTIQRIVRVNDLNKSWEMASFRHRLATLGAIWSESIKGGAAPTDVVRTARELATEAPRDTRARDLADVANASSRLDGSGSSGSDLR